MGWYSAGVSCGGSGTGVIKTNPRTMGMDVPSARTRRNSDVSPGKSRYDMLEKKKAERPKPDMTIPTAVARYVKKIKMRDGHSRCRTGAVTSRSGNDLAVVLMQAARPAHPPRPVKKLHRVSKKRVTWPRLSPSPTPRSNMTRTPKYPVSEKTKALARSGRGPRASTSLPQTGALM